MSDQFDVWIGTVLLRTGGPTLFASALFVALGIAPTPATARTRMAVLFVAENAALADNLSEVAISHLAQRDEWELVGEHELRGRLAAILPAAGLNACVAESACRAALATTAQIDRTIIGEVQQHAGGFVLDLALVDLRTGAADARSSETVVGDQARLIWAVRDGIDHLFAPKVTVAHAISTPELPAIPGAGAPVLSAAALPSSLSLRRDEDLPSNRRESLVPYVGFGAGGAAVVSLSAAAVTGSFATQSLSGTNRAQMQADLNRREEYATATNVLLGVGAACAATAAVALYRWWRASPRAPLQQPAGEPGLTR